MATSREALLVMFSTECALHIEELEANLIELERGSQAEDWVTVIHSAFRIVHTLKGNAAVVHETEIEWFAHVIESVMARMRDGLLKTDDDLVSTLLACCDHMRFLLSQVGADHKNAMPFAEEDRAKLIGMLVPYLGEEDIEEVSLSPNGTVESSNCWRLSLRFSPRALLRGLDPLDFLRHLESIGKIMSLTVLQEDLPQSEVFDPTVCYLKYELVLDSGAERQTIEDIFTLARDECELILRPPQEHVDGYIGRIHSVPEDLHTGEILMRIGAVTPGELARGLRRQRSEDVMHRPLGSILVDEGVVAPEVIDAVLMRQDQIKQNVLHEHHLLRIPVTQIDQLGTGLEGIVQTLQGLAMRGSQISQTEMSALLHALEKSRQQVDKMRTTRFGEQFRRLNRVVRDLGQELGKRADLLVSGGEISLDRTSSALLDEVLLHMIRNAMVHGIETPSQRQQRGKSAKGTLAVQAREEDGRLIFTVSDDGAGIDLEHVRAMGIEAGLIASTDQVNTEQLLALLFEPGFSTTSKVSHYSGRGVGLDVVRESVAALNGKISLTSQVGKGTRFEISLPRAVPEDRGVGAVQAMTHRAA